MPNLPSQMIPDMFDYMQIWGSGRSRKSSNSAETVLRHPICTTWFPSTAVQFPRVWHHSKRRRRWVSVKGSTPNLRHDPKCPLARQLHMVREDTEASSEGATCAWIAADEAVGCTRAFLTMWRSSRRLVCRGRLEPGPRVNGISRIHWSQHLL
ncbi:uncharacterized protein TNCV_3839851 [Trichonephila clavipes]|nr:uncharacterized protein TNCV_3839851 [Trichonephila clavipes]